MLRLQFTPAYAFRVLIFIVLALPSKALEDYELDLYDLVEEVNGTFYEFLDVKNTVETSEIRKAYRRLSLVLHPDKSKEPDAEIKFRQLVGIYEILRNPEKRHTYDDVLVNGLPTWRQPIYYYRKVRKFGFMESGLALLVTASVIHYAMLWAAFWEKKYNIEEVYKGRLKKNSKRKNHAEWNEEVESVMEMELKLVQPPGFKDLLICLIVYGSFCLIVSIPHYLRAGAALIVKDRGTEVLPDSSESDVKADNVRKKVRCDGIFSNMNTPEMASDVQPVVYQAATLSEVETDMKGPSTPKKAQWTETDDSRLARAMQKFPQGTVMRWEKIAQQLNHTPSEVLNRAKKLKTESYAASKATPTSLPQIKKKLEVTAQGGISLRGDDSVASPSEENGSKPTVAAEWTQLQQKALETALVEIPKTVEDRWSEIAKRVSGKTKAECIARYKHLAEMVKQKKQGT